MIVNAREQYGGGHSDQGGELARSKMGEKRKSQMLVQKNRHNHANVSDQSGGNNEHVNHTNESTLLIQENQIVSNDIGEGLNIR